MQNNNNNYDALQAVIDYLDENPIKLKPMFRQIFYRKWIEINVQGKLLLGFIAINFKFMSIFLSTSGNEIAVLPFLIITNKTIDFGFINLRLGFGFYKNELYEYKDS